MRDTSVADEDKEMEKGAQNKKKIRKKNEFGLGTLGPAEGRSCRASRFVPEAVVPETVVPARAVVSSATARCLAV